MSDNIQVPIAELQELAIKFQSMKEDLDGTERQATKLTGVDENDGKEVVKAVDEFLQEWQQSRQTLLKNIGILGEVSQKIADTAAEFDEDAASGIGDATCGLSGEE